MTPRTFVVPLVAALLLSGCVRLRWSRENRFEPLAEEAKAQLVPGESTLGDVLERLGAPLYVWEQTSASFAVAYGWYNGRTAGGTFSIPIDQGISASFSYDDLAAKLYGIVLTFDQEERLTIVREGFLREIAPELLHRRPSFNEEWVKDDEGEQDG